MSASATIPPRPSGTRLDSLTGARFVAAIGVFLFHAGGIFPAVGIFGTALAFAGRDGAIGVDFFFALSGFVLAWSWRPGGSVRAFYRRRFARIAPAYWVALVYGLVWVVILYRDPLTASLRAIPAALGIQAWFPDPNIHFAANGVEWSVSAELFFYALFPLLVRLADGRVARWVLVGGAVLLGFVLPAVLAALPSGDLQSWALNILPVTRLGEFACGLLLARFLAAGRRLPVKPWIAVVMFLACYLLLPSSPAWVPQRTVFLLSILLVIGALAGADLARRRTVASSRALVRLGEWSYCFYLVHQMTSQIALFVCAKVVPGKLLGPVWLLVALGASVGIAALLYRFVERPLERRLRGAAPRATETMPPPASRRGLRPSNGPAEAAGAA